MNNLVYLTDFSSKEGENDIVGAIQLLKSSNMGRLEVVVYENEGGKVEYLKELESEVCDAISRGQSINFKFQTISASCGAAFYVFCHIKSKKYPNQVSLEHFGDASSHFKLLFHQTRLNIRDIDVSDLDIRELQYDYETCTLSLFESNKSHTIVVQLKESYPNLADSIDNYLANSDNIMFLERFQYALKNLCYVKEKSVTCYESVYQNRGDVILLLN